jgi:polyhydroxyalkanoate synthesis repressor PhaR
MGTVTETSGAADKPRRVIKRYSNRKLYDTKDSRYVTLQQIGEMVRAGEEVQIIDNATKEDKTEVTLALIISEDLKSQPRSVPLGTLRDLIQERGERLLSQLREGPIGRLIPGSTTQDGAPAAPGTTGETPKPPARPAEAAPPAAPEPPPPPPPPPPPATAGVPPAPPSVEGDKPKTRFTEIVESSKHTLDQWQHTLDERIRTILPGVGLFRELQAEVKALTQRVEELEAKLQSVPANSGETPHPGADGAEDIKKE